MNETFEQRKKEFLADALKAFYEANSDELIQKVVSADQSITSVIELTPDTMESPASLDGIVFQSDYKRLVEYRKPALIVSNPVRKDSISINGNAHHIDDTNLYHEFLMDSYDDGLIIQGFDFFVDHWSGILTIMLLGWFVACIFIWPTVIPMFWFVTAMIGLFGGIVMAFITLGRFFINH